MEAGQTPTLRARMMSPARGEWSGGWLVLLVQQQPGRPPGAAGLVSLVRVAGVSLELGPAVQAAIVLAVGPDDGMHRDQLAGQVQPQVAAGFVGAAELALVAGRHREAPVAAVLPVALVVHRFRA